MPFTGWIKCNGNQFIIYLPFFFIQCDRVSDQFYHTITRTVAKPWMSQKVASASALCNPSWKELPASLISAKMNSLKLSGVWQVKKYNVILCLLSWRFIFLNFLPVVHAKSIATKNRLVRHSHIYYKLGKPRDMKSYINFYHFFSQVSNIASIHVWLATIHVLMSSLLSFDDFKVVYIKTRQVPNADQKADCKTVVSLFVCRFCL